MRIEELREMAGPDRYRRGCELVRLGGRTATADWPSDAADPHELADFVWRATDELPPRARLELAQALYRDMPSYAVLMHGTPFCKELRFPDESVFWDEIRALLSSADDGLAEPVAYWLAHDWFDSSRIGQRAWDEVTLLDEPYERRLERLLVGASWSVPWDQKAELYERLLTAQRWHHAIFRSLLDSAESVAGVIDRRDAHRIFARLQLDSGTAGVDTLKRSLRDGWALRRRRA